MAHAEGGPGPREKQRLCEAPWEARSAGPQSHPEAAAPLRGSSRARNAAPSRTSASGRVASFEAPGLLPVACRPPSPLASASSPQCEPRSSHTVSSQASSPRPGGPRGLVRRPPGRTRPRSPRPGLSECQSRCDAEGSRRARRGPAPSPVRADFLRDTPLPSLWGRALPARSAALGLSSSPVPPCGLMVPWRARPSRGRGS